jgi:glycosyltransferase involved in cell wall biosynthesis
MGWATRIVSPTPYLTEVYARAGLTADVIPNFLDVEREGHRFRVRDPVRPVFLANRNLQPLYNYPVILAAFAHIQAEVPEARLIIAGDGPEGPRLRALVEERALRNVEFRGKLSHTAIIALYNEADVYLNAPNLDCFPGSILEAFAAGIPVVSSNVGGIRYIVAHGRTGLLVSRVTRQGSPGTRSAARRAGVRQGVGGQRTQRVADAVRVGGGRSTVDSAVSDACGAARVAGRKYNGRSETGCVSP